MRQVLQRVVCTSVLLSLVSLPALASDNLVRYQEYFQVEIPEWQSPYIEACRENIDCTPEWAFVEAYVHGVLPKEVAEQAIHRFLAASDAMAVGQEPDWDNLSVCYGDVVFMAFGATELRFAEKIKVAVAGCVAAKGWLIEDASGGVYQVFQVDSVGNFGGRPVDNEYQFVSL